MEFGLAVFRHCAAVAGGCRGRILARGAAAGRRRCSRTDTRRGQHHAVLPLWPRLFGWDCVWVWSGYHLRQAVDVGEGRRPGAAGAHPQRPPSCQLRGAHVVDAQRSCVASAASSCVGRMGSVRPAAPEGFSGRGPWPLYPAPRARMCQRARAAGGHSWGSRSEHAGRRPQARTWQTVRLHVSGLDRSDDQARNDDKETHSIPPDWGCSLLMRLAAMGGGRACAPRAFAGGQRRPASLEEEQAPSECTVCRPLVPVQTLWQHPSGLWFGTVPYVGPGCSGWISVDAAQVEFRRAFS